MTTSLVLDRRTTCQFRVMTIQSMILSTPTPPIQTNNLVCVVFVIWLYSANPIQSVTMQMPSTRATSSTTELVEPPSHTESLVMRKALVTHLTVVAVLLVDQTRSPDGLI